MVRPSLDVALRVGVGGSAVVAGVHGGELYGPEVHVALRKTPWYRQCPIVQDPRAFKKSSLRGELLAVYAEVDALLSPFSCEGSTDCCRFGITGREPYPTAIERAELEIAVRARGGLPRPRSLPVAGERRCPLLTDEGRCSIYEARPFGCRTFFCARASGPSRLPRAEIQRLGRRVLTLSERYAPADPHAAPLSRLALGGG